MGKGSDKLYMRASEHMMTGGSSAAIRYHSGITSAHTPASRPLPFNCCALTLAPFSNPVASPAGVVFDAASIVPYLKKNPVCPSTGSPLTRADLIPLEMAKDDADGGAWHCPVLCKKFTDNTKVCFIKSKPGEESYVYSYEAVSELNLKAKNMHDLISGEKFSKKDIVVIQDPTDPEVCARRDITNFKFLKSQSDIVGDTDGVVNVKQNVSMSRVMDAVKKNQNARDEKEKADKEKADKEKQQQAEGGAAKKERAPILTSDLIGSAAMTSGAAAASLTSSAASAATSSATRFATQLEIDDSVAFILKSHRKKKSFATLQLNIGTIQLELDSDMCPLTCINFTKLVTEGYYDNTTIHRLIPNFMAQMGDPTGTGKGGRNYWNTEGFPDEVELAHGAPRHDKRGVLSMANSGPGTNKSQFFLSFKPLPHLDGKHTVFGRVIEGLGVLDALEKMQTGKDDRPVEEVRILAARMVVDKVQEAEDELYKRVASRERKEREEKARKEELIKEAKRDKILREGGSVAEDVGFKVGKYMTAAPPAAKETKVSAAAGETEDEFGGAAAPPKKKKKVGGFGNFGNF
jgi:peptidyl-prolyl cis-trans isomerase-like protein 2